jgi:hypothetical protein
MSLYPEAATAPALFGTSACRGGFMADANYTQCPGYPDRRCRNAQVHASRVEAHRSTCEAYVALPQIAMFKAAVLKWLHTPCSFVLRNLRGEKLHGEEAKGLAGWIYKKNMKMWCNLRWFVSGSAALYYAAFALAVQLGGAAACARLVLERSPEKAQGLRCPTPCVPMANAYAWFLSGGDPSRLHAKYETLLGRFRRGRFIRWASSWARVFLQEQSELHAAAAKQAATEAATLRARREFMDRTYEQNAAAEAAVKARLASRAAAGGVATLGSRRAFGLAAAAARYHSPHARY